VNIPEGTLRLRSNPTRVDPVVMAWSGGKDSSLALGALRADPDIEVVALLTTVTSDYDRISMHGVRREILAAQVEAIGLPLIEAPIPADADNDTYERSFAGALDTLQARRPGLWQLAFGDLYLADVRAYREQLLSRLGWTPLFPLWGQNTGRLARRFIQQGYRAILTCVDVTQLDPDFSGREFDSDLLDDLPDGVDPCGERGEFHTCVYDGPTFRHALPVQRGDRVRRGGRFEYCDLVLAGTSPAAV